MSYYMSFALEVSCKSHPIFTGLQAFPDLADFESHSKAIMELMLTESQQTAPEDKRTARVRLMLRYMPILIAIAAIYAAIVLVVRWNQTRDAEAKEEAAASAEKRESDARALDAVGGTEFRILSFYATPGLVHRGDQVEICYGVANAQSVKIEPDLGRNVWPSVNRCIDITPKKTTTYTLTAQDAHGNSKTESFTLEVH